ncbi:hypothetical protein PGIGA_G00075660 [Pangasianodon gigas]|uniref:Uncharacterized protein n=1 Tax=Pangasianodon gigas TaxID=30993 RepID=A0ACC5XAI9_PANGG|nr:hypothetical protein [Pangasianodon gigas]
MPLPEPRTRPLWMRVRSKDWWDNVVLHHFTDEEWKENFRMTRQSFMTLCSTVEGYIAPGEATVRAPVPLAAVRHTSLRDLDMAKQYSQVDILRVELLQNLEDAGETVTSYFSDVARLEVVSRIEEVTKRIVSSLSKEEAPVLVLKSRSRWSNVR